MSRRRRRSFDFRRYGTLQGWWDPSDSATRTIATGVSQLNDKSGNARNFTQATESKQPTVVSAGQNGRDTLKITAGTSQNLFVFNSYSAFNFLHNGKEGRTFQVLKHGESSNPESFVFGFHNNGSSSGEIGTAFYLDDRVAVGNQVLRIMGTCGVSTTFTLQLNPANAYTPNQYNLFSIFVDANTSRSNRALASVNGVLNAARNTETGTSSPSNATRNLTLGFNGATTGTAFYGDLLIYSALGASYSESFINSLLRQKWGTY